eukprot:TRINITY_DN10344_c0_g2_i5.p1 TRINITY_DN10344_c0_g2~~TRINITY_DN10344_c0_g2_i5.p1  ORF type:complete len:671 (-),score=118.18 TRINITY_DN10344_c0_g2_i5:287-2299(-)
MRLIIPGLNNFDFEKVQLINQYTYIDQLIMHLSQIAGQDTSKALLSQPKKDFLRKLNSDTTARSEFNRLAQQLPPLMKDAVNSEGAEYNMFFCREGVTIQRPYLTKQMRENLRQYMSQGIYINELKNGDLVHIPFSDSEKRVIATFPCPRQSLSNICSLLPGRSGIDILRLLDECELHQQQVGSGAKGFSLRTLDDGCSEKDVMIYNFAKSHTHVQKKQTMFDITNYRQFKRDYGLPPRQRKTLAKALLSELKYIGQSTASTEAIVDCKLDPTGKTSKVIVGTARNETTNATNVSVLYDLELGTINCLTEHHDTVSASDFSIDGEHIITASYDKNIIVRKSSDGVVERYLGQIPGEPVKSHEDKILSMVLHKENSEIIATFSAKQIFIWNIMDGHLKADLTKKFPVTGSVVDMCFASGLYKDTLVVGNEGINSKGEMRLWDTVTGTMVFSIVEPRGTISSVATNTGSNVISATKQTLRLFDLRQPNDTVALFKTGQKDVNIVSFSPCERYLQSSGTDNRCIVFDVRFPKCPVQTLHHLPPPIQDHATGLVGINSAVWTQDGNFLVTGGEDGYVRVWDIAVGDPLVNSLGGSSPICGCDVSPNFDMVVAGDEAATIKVWSTKYSKYTIQDEDLMFINRPRAVVTGPPSTNVEAILDANIAHLAAQLDATRH